MTSNVPRQEMRRVVSRNHREVDGLYGGRQLGYLGAHKNQDVYHTDITLLNLKVFEVNDL